MVWRVCSSIFEQKKSVERRWKEKRWQQQRPQQYQQQQQRDRTNERTNCRWCDLFDQSMRKNVLNFYRDMFVTTDSLYAVIAIVHIDKVCLLELLHSNLCFFFFLKTFFHLIQSASVSSEFHKNQFIRTQSWSSSRQGDCECECTWFNVLFYWPINNKIISHAMTADCGANVVQQ